MATFYIWPWFFNVEFTMFDLYIPHKIWHFYLTAYPQFLMMHFSNAEYSLITMMRCEDSLRIWGPCKI